jgi:ABC-2 type transport system permease protein
MSDQGLPPDAAAPPGPPPAPGRAPTPRGSSEAAGPPAPPAPRIPSGPGPTGPALSVAGGPPGRTGSIYDIGYRGYDGPRLGRRHAVATLYRQSIRAVFGLGRPARAKILPAFCLTIPALLAIIVVGFMAFATRVGAQEVPGIPGHPDLNSGASGLAIILVAAQAPELLGRDVRYRVLTVYFSRALLRVDYAFAKLAALATAVAILLLLPQVILTVGNVLLTSDVSGAIGTELKVWPVILASVVVDALATAAMALIVAAIIARRAYATAAIFALFIVPGILAAIVIALQLGTLSHYVVLVDVGQVLAAADAWFFGVSPTNETWIDADLPTWLGVVTALIMGVGGSAIVAQRYRTIEA